MPSLLNLPDVPSSPSELSIKFPLRAPNSLRSRGMHPIIAEYRDVVPLVESQWSLPPAYTGWSSAWRAVQAVRLPSPYIRDTAFRYLHRVLLTPDRMFRLGIASEATCTICGHGCATNKHVFDRCPRARSFPIPLRRILSVVYGQKLPSTIKLYSVPFLHGLLVKPASAFVLWTFVLGYWTYHSKLSNKTFLSMIASCM